MTALRELLATGDDPYAGGDLVTARRLGAVIWALSTLFGVLLLFVYRLDRAIGDIGWVLYLAGLAAGLACAKALADGRVPITWDRLLPLSYAGVVEVAFAHWLTGGGPSAFAELYLPIAAYAGMIHPPRRVLGVLAAVAVASALPLAYGGWDARLAAETVTRVLLFSALAMTGAALMRTVRAQRVALRDRGEQLARIDPLTELPNRRAFEELLLAEMSRARRSGEPLSLVVADLDRFKVVNDEHGHLEGDACLRAVADALRAELRQHDACFRWGGDEFALLLPGATRTEADAACGRISCAVELGCRRPEGTPMTLTCAAAQLTEGMTAEDFIRAGDAALLAVKAGRRHLRVV